MTHRIIKRKEPRLKMVLSLIFLPRYKFYSACFLAVRNTNVCLATAEKFLRNIVVLLPLERSQYSLFLHLIRVPSSAPGSGTLIRQIGYFLPFLRAVSLQCADLIKLVFSDTKDLQHLFDVKCPYSARLHSLFCGKSAHTTKYEHFPSNGKWALPFDISIGII